MLGAMSEAGIVRYAHAQPDAGPEREVRRSAMTPPLADFEARARLLFDAILRADPTRAKEVFFPRAAFLLVKAMPNPGRYYDKLLARFEQDIHALHKTVTQDARFERFELSKRGGYVKPGEEGNRLPYWAARHCFLHYRERGQLKKLEVRVVITWQERWYVIHLSEFQ
jgi:hypothetical protein